MRYPKEIDCIYLLKSKQLVCIFYTKYSNSICLPMIINCNVKDNSKTPVAIETTEVVALEGFLISESGHSGMEVGSEASSLYKEK